MSHAAEKSSKMRAEKRLFHVATMQCTAVLGRTGRGSNCRDQQEVGKEEEGSSNVSGLFKLVWDLHVSVGGVTHV